jgi:hypothetical protein
MYIHEASHIHVHTLATVATYYEVYDASYMWYI